MTRRLWACSAAVGAGLYQPALDPCAPRSTTEVHGGCVCVPTLGNNYLRHVLHVPRVPAGTSCAASSPHSPGTHQQRQAGCAQQEGQRTHSEHVVAAGAREGPGPGPGSGLGLGMGRERVPGRPRHFVVALSKDRACV